jgi:hypothetical protein
MSTIPNLRKRSIDFDLRSRSDDKCGHLGRSQRVLFVISVKFPSSPSCPGSPFSGALFQRHFELLSVFAFLFLTQAAFFS